MTTSPSPDFAVSNSCGSTFHFVSPPFGPNSAPEIQPWSSGDQGVFKGWLLSELKHFVGDSYWCIFLIGCSTCKIKWAQTFIMRTSLGVRKSVGILKETCWKCLNYGHVVFSHNAYLFFFASDNINFTKVSLTCVAHVSVSLCKLWKGAARYRWTAPLILDSSE